MGWLNAALTVFNLLPGAPLDGGRIVRAIAWRVTGDPYRSSRIAAQAGRVLGALIAAVGIVQVFFTPAGAGDGLWLAFIGWFLGAAAGQELAYARLQERLAGIPAGDIVSRAADPIPVDAPVSEAVHGWFETFHDDAFVVVDEGGHPVGMLRTDDVRRLAPPDRSRLRARDVMQPLEGLPSFPPDAPASSLLEELGEHGAVLLAGTGSRPAVVTTRGLLARIGRLEELDGGSRVPGRQRAGWRSQR
jgi:CBS domain-containing protein